MKRILFVCVENSNRSPMAEAFARLREDWQLPDPKDMDPEQFAQVEGRLARSFPAGALPGP